MDELDLINDEPEDLEVPCEINDEERAEDHLRYLRYWQQRAEKIRDHAQAEHDKIAAWETEQLSEIEEKEAWHRTGLIAWVERIGAKGVKLINGSIKRIKGRERVEVGEGAELPDELMRVKREPDKKAIKDYIQRTGEIPSGVDLITGEDTWKVEV